MRSVAQVAILFVALTASGCAHSLVADGRIRPAAFESILQRTVRARGIDVDGPVDVRVVSQPELVDVLNRALDAQWSDAELRDYERALVALGLWPRDRDLRAEFLAVMGDEVAGVYVPADRALYVVDGIAQPLRIRLFSFLLRRDLMMEAVLSHEIVHLLQHRAYPELLDPARAARDQDDLVFAVQAALEGDATRYGFEALGVRGARLPPEELREQLDEEMRSVGHGALSEAPALIRFTMGYPYVEGYRLSYGEGPELLDRPPASTEQALHPGRRHEPFWVFDLSDANAALPPTCTPAHANTVGELQMSVLFRDLGDAPAPGAWEGWDGDRFLAAECSGQVEFVWLTAWDTQRDAREFEQAYGEIAPAVAARAGYAAPPQASRSEREVVVVSPGLLGWEADLASLARRRRVATRGEVRDHFAGAAGR